MVDRADGLDPYVSGLPREWVERIVNSDENTDVLIQTTRIFHKPTVTSAVSVSAPGQGPQPLAIGTVMGLHFDTATDAAYRVLKIPRNMVIAGNSAGVEPHASFHIHWTKAVDSNESGNTVRWRISYTVFDGKTDEIATATPVVLDLDDTYDDAGTTDRVVHRTANIDATGLIPDYYLGIKIEYVAGSTTLLGGPVLISADALVKGWLNTNANGFI